MLPVVALLFAGTELAGPMWAWPQQIARVKEVLSRCVGVAGRQGGLGPEVRDECTERRTVQQCRVWIKVLVC